MDRHRALAVVSALAIALSAESSTSEPLDTRDSYLTITDDPKHERLMITLGPIDLPARTPHRELVQIPVQFGRVPFDLTIHGYWVQAVDRDGEPVPQSVIHHFNLLDPRGRELFLPIMQRVLAASHETQPQHLPGWLFGIPMRGDHSFVALTMLHNPTDADYEGVSVSLVIEYERSRVFPLLRAHSFHMDVMFPLGSKAFDLPPGRTVKSWEGSPAIQGEIVGMGGHLHRYASRLLMQDLTTGDTIYDEKPVLAQDGAIAEVPVRRFYDLDFGYDLYPDRRYRVTAEYLNPTRDTIRDGGMGSVAGLFLPNEPWPGADTANYVYRADYRNVLSSVGHAHASVDGGR
jgi:hypothetical protein